MNPSGIKKNEKYSLKPVLGSGGQDGSLLMLVVADPTKEETEDMLANLPSRTGQLQDRNQVYWTCVMLLPQERTEAG